MTITDQTAATAVSTPLYIGGEVRSTKETLAIADPGKPGVIVGHAASASAQDVADAVAAAKAAFPAWSALTPQERAAAMTAAIDGVAAFRDEDAAILSQENGKVRFEAWVDALVFEIRWGLALSLADQVDTSSVLEPIPGAIPTRTTVELPAARRRHGHRAVQLADRDPRCGPAARPAGR